MKNGIFKGGGVAETDPRLDSFLDRVEVFPTNLTTMTVSKGQALPCGLDEELGTPWQPVVLLGLAPEYFGRHHRQTGAHGMAPIGEEADNWSGSSSRSHSERISHRQRSSMTNVNAVFSEDQIFRIDHYLGKETVQNILFFRFGNGIFEPIWNRNYVERVEITLRKRSVSRHGDHFMKRPERSATYCRITRWKSSR